MQLHRHRADHRLERRSDRDGPGGVLLARGLDQPALTTASPHNFEYVQSLGADAAIDYHSNTAVDELVEAIGKGPLAGILAVIRGSVVPAAAIVRRTTGTGRIAAAQPALMSRIQLLRSGLRGVSVSAIWGGTLKDNAGSLLRFSARKRGTTGLARPAGALESSGSECRR
jgi:NADPH:quinone reductase-like Zn-dependent oxidoreductase